MLMLGGYMGGCRGYLLLVDAFSVWWPLLLGISTNAKNSYQLSCFQLHVQASSIPNG